MASHQDQIHLRVPEDLKAKIETRAALYKLPVAEWCRLALDRVVEMPPQTNRSREQRF